jgi:hypothetical protein
MLPSVFRRCGANLPPVSGKEKAVPLRYGRPVSEVKGSVDALGLKTPINDIFHNLPSLE